MRLTKHSELSGQHAFLSPSKYHWVNYDVPKLHRAYLSARASAKGVALHELAYDLIRLGVPLRRNNETLSLYVNDAIRFGMTPEQGLFYSSNCFGTADTLSFVKNVLRISDLKTGVSQTSERQLEIYAALFCLEYRIDPTTIVIELRIYQSREVRLYLANPLDIVNIMEKIVYFDQVIEEIKEEGSF